jgi:alcohol dehydrogenase
MRQLMFLGRSQVEWREVPEPRLAGDLEAIVEPIAVATCDLDVAMLRGTLNPFPGPFPLGHESVARVAEVGESVLWLSAGDAVVVPFQISCGTRPACSAGRIGNCTTVAQGSIASRWPAMIRAGAALMGAARADADHGDRRVPPRAQRLDNGAPAR